MLVVNFKAYVGASGRKARELAESLSEAKSRTGRRIIGVPQHADLLRLEETGIEVFSQHIDPVSPGSHTGSMLPGAVMDAGASGTLLNHSERRLEPRKIRESVEIARELGMTSVVCAQDPGEVEDFSSFRPDYVAFEPPELIGGDISVASAKPGLIEEAVERSSVPVLTGAGIKDREDVEKSMELGTEGVLVASGVVKAENQMDEAIELCRGLE